MGLFMFVNNQKRACNFLIFLHAGFAKRTNEGNIYTRFFVCVSHLRFLTLDKEDTRDRQEAHLRMSSSTSVKEKMSLTCPCLLVLRSHVLTWKFYSRAC